MQRGIIRYMLLTILCGGMLWSHLACAPPALTTSSGHSVVVQTKPHPILFTITVSPVPNNYLGFGEVVVLVHDAQGRPAEGVPVLFELEPAWAASASLRPQRVITQGGQARAIVEPHTTGVLHIRVRVADVRRDVAFVVESQEFSSTPRPGLRGLPYPPQSVR